MILAGHETTAVALCWSVYLLAHLPEVQEQIAQEAAAMLADNMVEPQFSKLTYTRAVLDEVMRLYPPAYVIVRAARQQDDVAGVAMQPGDLAIISPGFCIDTANAGTSRMRLPRNGFCPAPRPSIASPTCPLVSGLACALALTSLSPRLAWC